MTDATTVRLATRGSDLALRQAATVKDTLEDRGSRVELVEVDTTGDQLRDELIHRLGKTGAFVRSLDEKVIEGDVDAAVHSMKDVPTEQPDELVVAGVPKRASPGDVLVTPDETTLADLPAGATVGTSSLRRTAQLLAERSDLDIRPLRGNVDTRVEKLLAPGLQAEHEERTEEVKIREETADEDYEFPYDQSVEEWFDSRSEIERQALGREVDTAYDAIVLARAGLERAGLLHHVEYRDLPATTFVPAPGQGALAITAVDSEFAVKLSDVLDHPRSRAETTVERTILAELGGGCVAPMGVHAVLQGSVIRTTVRVLDREGAKEVRATRDLDAQRHIEAAQSFGAALAEQGADDLIAAAKRGAGNDDAATVQGDTDE
ncbi:hydroxymethylbilane synthase [Halobacteriales archaeon QS_4_62_28]|nr:MAG: hydroxymethylbilane synthase [Halobacteriales archaeon QS_4_62_28]